VRKGGLLWGFLLLLAGVLFLLDNLGFLPISALSLFFSSALILIGLWFLLGPLVFRQVVESRTLVIPADGTSEANLKIRHGAGGLLVSSLSGNSNILEGSFAGGVDERINRSGSKTDIKLSVPEMEWWGFPNASPMNGLKWDLALNREIAFTLDLKTGASKNRLDLHDLIITDIHMETGASETEVFFPEQAGLTRGEFHFGTAQLELHIPENVAAQIRIQGAMLDTAEIDSARFPKTGDVFCSPNFTEAVNKVDINIEAGLGKVIIH
jgi:hypothetical protein